MEKTVLQEKLEQGEKLDNRVLEVLQDSKVFRALRVPRVKMDQLAPEAWMVTQVPRARQVPRAKLVRKA